MELDAIYDVMMLKAKPTMQRTPSSLAKCVLVIRCHTLGPSNDDRQGFMIYNFVMMLLFDRFYKRVLKGARDNVTNFSRMTQVVHPLQRAEQCVPWICLRLYIYREREI